MSGASTAADPAYEIRIEDTELQAYLQRWPFATGPDAEKNRVAREAVRQSLARRQTGTPVDVVPLSAEQTLLSAEEDARLQSILRSIGFDRARQRVLIDDFAWEANQVPRSSANVLDVGCGDGMELLFLRAILPRASMTAIDYRDSLTAEVKRIADPILHEGDLNRILGSLPGGYDLIYSNHTLEHLYTPERIMTTLYGLLAPGGSLISVLPLDANPGCPFLEEVARMAGADSIHPLDLVYLDAGHPWKTNPQDLARTLLEAGFREVTLYQRSEHVSRFVAGSSRSLALGRNVGLALNGLFFSPARVLIKALVPESQTPVFARVLQAIERRVWFGCNNLKNRYTEEALIHAIKPA